MNQLDLKGRNAVVTGGAAGIGFAIAQRLVASGARVSLWDRDDKALADGREGARRRPHTAHARREPTRRRSQRALRRDVEGARARSTRWSAAPASPART